MNNKKKKESKLKKMDRFQKTVRELEKMQERIDDTDNPMNIPTLMAHVGHLTYVVLSLCEQSYDFQQKILKMFVSGDKKNDKIKKDKNGSYFI